MNKTIDYYENNADTFVTGTIDVKLAEMGREAEKWLNLILQKISF
jgi:hypothetical protein